jgi:hypothetical protein
MAEATPANASSEQPEAPKRVCEKCRGEYAPEAFQHGVAGQECVCRRCLIVMGYRVKG